jgi:hypothetical protein
MTLTGQHQHTTTNPEFQSLPPTQNWKNTNQYATSSINIFFPGDLLLQVTTNCMGHRFLTQSNDRKNTANFLRVIAQTRMQIGRWLNLRGLVQELTLNDHISRKRGEHIKQHLITAIIIAINGCHCHREQQNRHTKFYESWKFMSNYHLRNG